MNIWIVNPYGTLPSEGWREYRSAMLARALAERGHHVRWWISDIEHRSKRRRVRGLAEPLLPASVAVEIVTARSYRRNISLGRILYERSFASGFARTSRSLPPPDLVVLADPSLFFASPVIDYVREYNVPFVLDVLDLWPEMFHILLPSRLRRFGQLLFTPLYRRRDRLVAEAAAVVAVTSDYLEAVTERCKAELARTVYLGVDTTAFQPPDTGPHVGEILNVIYAGTLGDAYDMAVVLAAVEHVARQHHPIRFTVVGDGPWRNQFRELAECYPDHLHFLGSLPVGELTKHYASAHIGLASYAPGSTVSMPVKFYDYMAAGLAIVGSMQGEAAALLKRGIGLTYRAGSSGDLVEKLLNYQVNRAALKAARDEALRTSRQFDQKIQHELFAELIDRILRRDEKQC